jgi:hypothetical protein
MLSKPVFEGDRVILEYTNRSRSETFPATVKRLGHDKIFIDCPDCPAAEKIQFREYGAGVQFSGWALWNTLDEYQEAKQRDRLISKIKKATQSWDFGKELAIEKLEAIAELMDVKQC